MEKAQQKLICSKISKFDKDLQFLDTNIQCSDQVKAALIQMKKDKKKLLHKRLNRRQQRLGPKKFEVNRNYEKNTFFMWGLITIKILLCTCCVATIDT